ncbi:MAG: amidohydrolase [Chloroflexi bacterium]|nr:amidohydrolase [Chloroflexota bacterium]
MAYRPHVIDVHHHWMPRDHVRRIDSFMREGEHARRGGDRWSLMRGGESVHNLDSVCVGDTEMHLRDMDEAGVDAAVFSLGIWLEWLTLSTSRETNDELAEIQRLSEGRVIGLAHVPPLEQGAEDELERAVRRLGLKGVNLTTHWQGTYLDEEPFRPFMRKVAALNVPIVVHASSSSGLAASLDGDSTHLGRVVDMTIIVTRLLKSDLLEELPNLRFQLPQLGGAWWAVKRRLRIDEPASTLGSRLRLLKNIWFDAGPASWAPCDLTLAVQNLGADRVMFGTDYPSTRTFMKRALDAHQATPYSDADRAAIMSENAIDFYGL